MIFMRDAGLEPAERPIAAIACTGAANTVHFARAIRRRPDVSRAHDIATADAGYGSHPSPLAGEDLAAAQLWNHGWLRTCRERL